MLSKFLCKVPLNTCTFILYKKLQVLLHHYRLLNISVGLKVKSKMKVYLDYIWTFFKIAIQGFYFNLLKITLVIFA